MPFDPVLIAVIAAVFLLAGYVKGVIGLGLPTISVGLLSLVMAPAQAAALLIVPSTITNIQQMRPAATLWPLTKRLWPMLAGIVAGTWAGSGLIAGSTAPWAAAALGAALILYAGLGLAKIQFKVAPRHEGWLAPLIGAVTGVITAATGVFVIPAVPYLQAIGMEKDELVQALGLSFFVSTLALGATLGGNFAAELAWGSLLTLIPALVGQYAGQATRARIDAAVFKRWFLLGLLALGVVLASRF
ncbi:sulfite exporter TauE/SafE family protein [Lacibacterium aquatile]|uniref:Probable membrane transporter protein n=1 Tax=Lacibacterium aquatile TaxID=1168082 RepID=A0ABW5DZR1_9PROT